MTNNISGSSFSNSKVNLNMGDVQNNTVVNSRPLYNNRHVHNHNVTVVKQTAVRPSYTKAKPKQAPKTSNHAKGYKRSSSSKTFTHGARASSTVVSKPQSSKTGSAPYKKYSGSSCKGSFKKFSTSKAKSTRSGGVKNRRATFSNRKYR